MVAGHRHQHGPHAEVDPAGGMQGTHAGIHEGQPGAAPSPELEAFRVAWTQSCGEGMELAELQIRLAFQLLDEVAVPVQPRFEAP